MGEGYDELVVIPGRPVCDHDHGPTREAEPRHANLPMQRWEPRARNLLNKLEVHLFHGTFFR